MTDTHGLFADDISVWQSDRKVKNLEKLLQLEINKVENYCQEWCLSINPLKTYDVHSIHYCKQTKIIRSNIFIRFTNKQEKK
jgi:hypothetical protein